MATKEMARVRITDESVANIEVASKARIEPEKGGYKVKVENEYGGEYLKDGNGLAIYRTKSAAKKVVERHNEKVVFHEEKVLPSPSKRPQEGK